jgi:hypothetical protein
MQALLGKLVRSFSRKTYLHNSQVRDDVDTAIKQEREREVRANLM